MDINKYGVKGRFSLRSVNTVGELEESDIYEVLWLAKKLKRRQAMKETLKDFAGRNVVIMLGSKNSVKRISFELAVGRLGGKTLYFSPDDADFAGGLTYADAMKAISSYGANGIILKNDDTNGLGGLPFINLADVPDVCNILANLFTVWEAAGRLSGLSLLGVGSGKNLCADEINAYAKCGVSVMLACSELASPDVETIAKSSQFGDLIVVHDAFKAAVSADLITSAAGENDGYYVSEELMDAAPRAYYIHSLPVKHGEEVDESVLYGKKSLAFMQAENLIYVEQALMLLLFGD